MFLFKSLSIVPHGLDDSMLSQSSAHALNNCLRQLGLFTEMTTRSVRYGNHSNGLSSSSLIRVSQKIATISIK